MCNYFFALGIEMESPQVLGNRDALLFDRRQRSLQKQVQLLHNTEDLECIARKMPNKLHQQKDS
jgi:hypothetical protein